MISPEVFVGFPSETSAEFPPEIFAGISAGLFPKISIGCPLDMFLEISLGISPIVPPPLIYPGIHLGVFTSFLGIPAGFLQES